MPDHEKPRTKITITEAELDVLLVEHEAWSSAEPEARKSFTQDMQFALDGELANSFFISDAWNWWYAGWLSKMLDNG